MFKDNLISSKGFSYLGKSHAILLRWEMEKDKDQDYNL